ncbi:phosphoglucosamine mutase [Guggenheimella bovis]
MGRYFGTDGVRGIANKDLTNEMAYMLGRYGAYVLTRHTGQKKARLLIGKDTRISSDMLESSLIAGILSVGCDAVKVGVVPTPAIAYLVRTQDFDAGVMISASHNSYEYNGIKFFSYEGIKLSDELEEEIEDYILGNRVLEETFTHDTLGRVYEDQLLKFSYLENAKNAIPKDFEAIKVLLDCANGSTSELAEKAFRDCGAVVNVLFNEPDGVNINDQCGSTHMDYLKERMSEGRYDIGLAFDGDGDRVLAVDEEGNEVDGDKIMAILGKYMLDANELKNNTIVATVMSNLGFMNYCKEQGIDVVQTKVGDRYVIERMRKDGFNLGGEQSGHIIFTDFNQTGDGILTGLKLVEAVTESGKTLSELQKAIPRYPQVIENAKINKDRKKEFDQVEAINARIRDVEEALHGTGRVLIRPSGTEPVIRVMLEGEDIEALKSYALELKELYERELN